MYKFVIPYDSAKDIPLKELKNLHKAYWMFIYEHKYKCKPDIVSESGELVKIDYMCFACEYANRVSSNCKGCPIYGLRVKGCIDRDEPYMKWQRTGDPKYALEIAELNWEDYDA